MTSLDAQLVNEIALDKSSIAARINQSKLEFAQAGHLATLETWI